MSFEANKTEKRYTYIHDICDIHIWVSRPKYKMCMGFSEVYQWNGD